MKSRAASESPRCDVIHDSGSGCGPVDDRGCCLADGHDGPHEFKDREGKIWNWEIDLECECDHCLRCEGDYCTTYWQKQPNVVGEQGRDYD